ncbi:MAG: hypothetical protein ACLUD0_17110 [Eubacterium ramulus]
MERQPFLESIRQFQHDVGHDNAILDPCNSDPICRASGEMKTKPHPRASVKASTGNVGIQPMSWHAVSEHPLTDEITRKDRTLFCNVPARQCITESQMSGIFM